MTQTEYIMWPYSKPAGSVVGRGMTPYSLPTIYMTSIYSFFKKQKDEEEMKC